MLPNDIKTHCEEVLGVSIFKDVALPGGDINQACLIKTSQGAFFLKFNRSDKGYAILLAEKKGLALIGQSGSIRVPKVIHLGKAHSGAFLILEYIPTTRAQASFWPAFAGQLAQLHQASQPHYGLDHDNFIGTLSQYNSPQSSAAAFLVEDRLRPQCQLAQDLNLLSEGDIKQLERLFKRIPQLIPPEPPALIHGDLWSGNFLVSEAQQVVIIDPAVAYGLREMDLAMSLLFGGFDAQFYQSYQEIYPMKSGWEGRMDIYQLYYLLAHLNMFGTSYLRSVRSIVQKYQ